ncbi:chemotaxis protein CheA [Halocynthiibacter namhaensis]|uniref:chemotaxis protein CheA n=1 Tax=Halocynthiibacter namhaensis TaxID=1290553 RepID=UPI0005792764|nr:chemotaxis protein CheA [Halocynthiibacter namhaensis]
MSDPMAEIKASFFLECEELLEQLQDGLNRFEEGDDDPETINEVFRAVHSIKGGAGAFSLTALVDFAHIFETSMDIVRSGEKTPSADDYKTFLHASDILCDLVVASRDETEVPKERIDGSVVTLRAFLGESGVTEEEDEVDPADFQPMGVSMDLPASTGLPDLPVLGGPPAPLGFPDPSPELPPADQSQNTNDTVDPENAPVAESADGNLPSDGINTFSIRFRPDPSLFTSGNEPLHLIKVLSGLGTAKINCVCDDLPPIDKLEGEESYLSWTIELSTSQAESSVREVFDFVEDLCELVIETDAFQSEQNIAPAPSTSERPPAPISPAPTALKSVAPSSAPVAPPVPQSAPSANSTSKPAAKAGANSKPAKVGGTVRVELDRVDRLVNLVGELVINQAMLSQSVIEAGIGSDQNVAAGLDEFMQLTRDIQDSVMAIRAQPVKSLFQRMGRIIREASSAVKKDVRFVTLGEATEVDKTVIERLADPLTHMIRNAVDHGLEDSEDRLANGKSKQGTVTLSASHKSGRVLIEISDDGAGINRPVVLRKATEKGLIAEGAQLTDPEIDNLLFLPGFSTAAEISNLSGRGVGMDVVRNAITALGGRISISSESGTGTTFTISLPLTLAVQDGMVIEVAGQTLVVPLNNIIETMTLSSENLREMGPATTVVQLRDQFVPLLDLAVELGFSSPRTSYDDCVALLISPEEDSMAAVVIDKIVEQRQVVIKGLQDSYGAISGIAAATILGDGQIALILDAGDVITNASGRTREILENPQLTGVTA